MHHRQYPLYVSIVGDVQIWSFGSIVPAPRRRAALKLLAFLLLHREVDRHQRDHVAEVLWPNTHKQTALTCLRQALHELRRALPAHPEGRAWIDTDAGCISWSDLGSRLSSVDAWELEDGDWRSITHPSRCPTGMSYLYFVAITDRISGEILPYLEDEWSISPQLQVERSCLSMAAQCLQWLTNWGEEYRVGLERVRLQVRLRSAVDIDADYELTKLTLEDGLDCVTNAADEDNVSPFEGLVRSDRDCSHDVWLELLNLAHCQRLITLRRTTTQDYVQDLRAEVARPLAASGAFDCAVWCAVARGQTDTVTVGPGGSSLLHDLDGLAYCISQMTRVAAEAEMRSLPTRLSGHIEALSGRSIVVLIDSTIGLEFNVAAACAHILNAGDHIRVICCSQVELGLAGETVVSVVPETARRSL